MTDSKDSGEDKRAQPQNLEQFLCFALYSASLAMTKLYQPHLKPLGLTYPQYLTLLALWEKDGVTVSEVGQRMHLESGTLSHLLKRLEQAGFISRTRDAGHDERRVIIRLTQAGRELESRAAGVPAAMICEMGIPYETLASLRDGVRHVQEKIIQALPSQENQKA
ncbi:MarR family transcriptional regulator [Pantoea ananatis]|uniref:MarR family winged helix-turn-helix transcriptional regulator n=1 Tax=Pantoea ananas TaxID=553 RepID=UPI000736EF96|nr:MarR family transcriptional regulator [Pantoea ananatis]AWQ20140.1 MarR family transcriptional regulator [Pantoea ananatis]KTR49951.1 MarR family transcriptional regulator [Pantoea ananatis]KTR55343.1 MarR family transcriptional regulator [Pantoea ananatis]KTR63203.1 MarR family transcriptional regulator [Pantoea ananatis]KTR69856.1 MarR family transcriptional regulator [Pantoea ananatis]